MDVEQANKKQKTMKSLLIFGGSGQLGRAVVKRFKTSNSFSVVSVDFAKNDDADFSILLKGQEDDLKHIKSELTTHNKKFDAVISVAGGFAMGNIADDSIMQTLDKMYNFNLKSAVTASHVASHFLNQNGLLVLTGAYGALRATPAFVSYGVSKAATHHLVHSLSQPDNGLPKGSSVAAILPVTLDTAQNRKDMPGSNFADWTPLEHVADLLLSWSSDSAKRPSNGALLQIDTKAGSTSIKEVKEQF